jgi:hypothetical protein
MHLRLREGKGDDQSSEDSDITSAMKALKSRAGR